MEDVTTVAIDLARKHNLVVTFDGRLAEIATCGRGIEPCDGTAFAEDGREFEQDVGCGCIGSGGAGEIILIDVGRGERRSGYRLSRDERCGLCGEIGDARFRSVDTVFDRCMSPHVGFAGELQEGVESAFFIGNEFVPMVVELHIQARNGTLEIDVDLVVLCVGVVEGHVAFAGHEERCGEFLHGMDGLGYGIFELLDRGDLIGRSHDESLTHGIGEIDECDGCRTVDIGSSRRNVDRLRSGRIILPIIEGGGFEVEVSDGVSPGGGDDVLFVLSLKEDNIYRVDVVFGLGGHLCAHIALHEVDGAEVQFYFA